MRFQPTASRRLKRRPLGSEAHPASNKLCLGTKLLMEVHMKLLQKIFRHPKTIRVVCFKVENYEDAYQRDKEVITKLERNLAAAGAIPAKIDFSSKLCCVTITDPSVEPENIQQVLEAVGLQATLERG
jgi:glutamate-1-semialdehyde aminotransferase